MNEHPHWKLAFAGAAVTGVLGGLMMLRTWPGTPAVFALAFLAQALASMLAIGASSAAGQWYDKDIYLAPLLQFALQTGLAGILFAEALRRLAGPPGPVPLHGPGSVIHRFGKTGWRDRLLAVFVLLATYETLWLALRPDLPSMHEPLARLPDRVLYWVHMVFHGRYRDFPIPEFLVPTLGLGLTLGFLWLFGRRPQVVPSPQPRLDGALVAVLTASILLLQGVENFSNREAMAWGAMAMALALLPLAALAARWSQARRITYVAPSP